MKLKIKKRNKNKKPMDRFLKKYLIIFFTILAIYLVFMATWVGSYTYLSILNPSHQIVQLTHSLFGLDSKITDGIDPNSDTASGGEGSENDQESLLGYVPHKTFFAIYGVDKAERLADVIMVVCFDKTDNSLSIISVPRDTGVTIPADYRKELSNKGVFVPNYEIKINAVHSWADKYGNEALTNQLNDLLNIKIDYYIQVNIQAFIDIVDTVGGIEIDVPQRLYYSDPTQDLLINLKPGLQTLDGEQAQGFVRFRQYKLGDVDRIKMQQLFMNELFTQVLDKEAIMQNLNDYTKTIFKYVDTDMKLQDAIKYAQFVPNLDISNLKMDTIPGIVTTPYRYDKEGTKQLVNELFYGIGTTETESTTELNETESTTKQNKPTK